MIDYLASSIGKCLAVAVGGLAASVPVVVATATDHIGVMGAEQWLQLALQSVGAFLMAIFLLWVWPQQNKFLREMTQDMQQAIRENNQSNSEVVANLSAAFERHDTAWRTIVSARGYCPVRDGHVKQEEQYEKAPAD